MAGDAADRGNDGAFVVLIEAKIFFVDLTGHLEHIAGNIFFRLGIAGKIQTMGSAVGGGSMTKSTFYTERSLPAIHHLFQVVVADVLWQYFQISFGLIVLGTRRGHPGYHQGKETDYNCNFFVMQHIGDFGPPI